MKREEKQLEVCLLTPEALKLADPQGPVLLCGLEGCPNRSDTVGDLGKACRLPR